MIVIFAVQFPGHIDTKSDRTVDFNLSWNIHRFPIVNNNCCELKTKLIIIMIRKQNYKS